MAGLEWAHAAAAIIGVLIGIVGTIFAVGRWVGRIEERMKRTIEKSINDCEKQIEDKVDSATGAFDETLKGLRQKINDVELDTERRFLLKGDFNDFREEYRENTNRIFDKLDQISRQ